MPNLLYITNIAGKRMSHGFAGSAIEAAKSLELSFYAVADRAQATPDDIKADEEKYGIHLLHIPLCRSPFSFQNIKAYNQLCDIIRENKIDYIHCNTPVGGLLGRLAGKKCGVKKIIYQAHGFHFYKGAPKKNWLLYYPIEKWLAHYTDALITINQEDYEAAKKFKLRNGGKVYYVPGVGIDLSKYQNVNNDSGRAKLRAELGLDENATVCISMGDLIPRKNYGVAISAIGRLQEKYHNLHYIICGKGQELEILKALAKGCGVETKVHFLGFRSDIKDLLKAADVFLFTSLQEGLPRSTMEAMASGLPIACSRIRGNTDLINEGKGGVLFDPKNVDEIATALDKLLSSDMEAMSRYNLDRIHDFSLDTASAKIAEVYQCEFSGNSGGGVLAEIKSFYPTWYQKRLELGLRATDTVLISVGRLDKNKNNRTLIKAVGLCNNPAIHLVICGDGEERDNLINLANTLGIASQVHFWGNRSDMTELYAMSDVFVMASYREGLSRSIMEAMASGLPCIVSDIRGNRDLIQDGNGGYLVKPNDTETFAIKIEILTENFNIRRKMKNANLERVKLFSKSMVSEKIETVYKDVLD